jgi:hypothetical protein
MSDHFVRLIESARRAPPSIRAVLPFEVEEQIETPQLSPTSSGPSFTASPPAHPSRTGAPLAVPAPTAERAGKPPAGRRAPEVVTRESALVEHEMPAAIPVPGGDAHPPASVARPPAAAPCRESVSAAAPPRPSSLVSGASRRPSAPRSVMAREQSTPVAPGVAERAEPPAAPPHRSVRPRPGPPPPRVPPAVAPPAATEEVVHVSIGRIEVRAAPPAPAPVVVPASAARPRQSLDDYLAERDRGRR